MVKKTEIPIWIKVLKAPKEAFPVIFELEPRWGVWPLALIQGLLSLSTLATLYALGRFIPLWLLLLGVLLLAPYVGYLMIWCFSYILHATGLWLGSTRGSVKRIRTVVSWSQLPLLGVVLLDLILLVILRSRLFLPLSDEVCGLELYLYYAFLSIKLLFFIWALFILVEGLHLVQRLSRRMIVIGAILSFLILFLVLYLMNMPFLSRCNNFFDFPLFY